MEDGRRMPAALPEEVEALSRAVVDGALKVHRALGPGLLESVYEACLQHELGKRGIEAARQRNLPIVYDGLKLEGGLRLDLLVADRLIVEIKAVDALLPIHKAQLLTYLRLSGLRHGLLINFNVVRLKDGIQRVAH
jgi:GxxExxY protein